MYKINSYSHIAFNVKDMDAMKDFYCRQLGMKEKFTMTTDDTIDFFEYEKSMGKEPSPHAMPHIEAAMKNPGKPLITYVEMAPNQFLELFYSAPDLEEPGNLAPKYGYQHLSIEVANLEDAWNFVTSMGVVPDTKIAMGPDFTKQFWIHDPEGNRIEFMEYTPYSFQLGMKGKRPK